MNATCVDFVHFRRDSAMSESELSPLLSLLLRLVSPLAAPSVSDVRKMDYGTGVCDCGPDHNNGVGGRGEHPRVAAGNAVPEYPRGQVRVRDPGVLSPG